MLYPPLTIYEEHLNKSQYRAGRFWDRGAYGGGDDENSHDDMTGSRILTVAVYFRDHDEDRRGLTVAPFTHTNFTHAMRMERAFGDNSEGMSPSSSSFMISFFSVFCNNSLFCFDHKKKYASKYPF